MFYTDQAVIYTCFMQRKL